MKKQILFFISMIVCVAAIDARHGWYGRRGGWGGWGWGPSFGVGFTVPIGGSSSSSYIPPYRAADPYNNYRSLFPKSDPVKVPYAYQRWLFSNYSPKDAQYWWNYFLDTRYNPYQASKPQPSGYISVGTGYGGYPYWGWGGPSGVSFGFGF